MKKAFSRLWYASIRISGASPPILTNLSWITKQSPQAQANKADLQKEKGGADNFRFSLPRFRQRTYTQHFPSFFPFLSFFTSFLSPGDLPLSDDFAPPEGREEEEEEEDGNGDVERERGRRDFRTGRGGRNQPPLSPSFHYFSLSLSLSPSLPPPLPHSLTCLTQITLAASIPPPGMASASDTTTTTTIGPTEKTTIGPTEKTMDRFFAWMDRFSSPPCFGRHRRRRLFHWFPMLRERQAAAERPEE